MGHRRRITPWPWSQPELPYLNVADLALQDSSHGPVCARRPKEDFCNYTLSTNNDLNNDGRLPLGKAKFLGIYTDMYELPLDNAHAWPARSSHFRRTRDP
jgi:hypothetical protein